jgi:VanZ family protein
LRDLGICWWPVAVWLCVIRVESTDYASSAHTLGLLYRIATWMFGPISPMLLFELNSDLRKSGHFVGYAILGWLVFRALKLTQHKRLRLILQRRLGIFFRDLWRWDWAITAVLFTAVTASFDELHQGEIASRSGRWQDVVLDTAGAVTAMVVAYFVARYRLEHPVRRKRSRVS